MSDIELIDGYRVKFLTDGETWQAVISDQLGTSLIFQGVERQDWLLPQWFPSKEAARAEAMAFIRGGVKRSRLLRPS